MPNDRLSRCVSALLRSQRSREFGAMEMAHYGILDDWQSDGKHVTASIEAPYKILESFGYTWRTLWLDIASRVGFYVWFEKSDWTNEEHVRHTKAPTSFHIGRHSEWFRAIPRGSLQDALVSEMLSHTP